MEMTVERLRRGEMAVGTMIRTVGTSTIAMLAAKAGLDFIMVDLEHGPMDMETLEEVFKVGRSLKLACFVRVPELTKAYVSRCLDLGATGVMVPMLESREQAERFVHYAKYPPLGGRGFGGIGAHTHYTPIPPDETSGFMERANLETLTIAQIETKGAIENIDSIASVPGLDALLIGPNDLSISMGCPGDLLGARLMEAISRVAEAAKAHGKIFGMHAPDPLLERWIPEGLKLVMSSLDTNILLAGMKGIASRYKA
jgi:2-keto-3-deoxy-L-rhamnonate aldolase RhmA